jgi:putative salt-induced outer membrane protein YdiY
MTKNTNLACLITSLLLAGTALAQGWENGVNAGLTLTDGNSESLSVNAGLESKRTTDQGETTASVAYNYAESTKADGTEETTTDNSTAKLKHNLTLTEASYAYLAADGLADEVAGIDYRLTVGPGLGSKLMRDENFTLAVEAGAAWIFEKVDGVSDDSLAGRFAQTYERKLSATAKTWQKVELLQSVESSDDYLLNGEIGVDSALSGALSLRLVVSDRYDNTPAADAERNDLSVIAGLAYKL